MLELAERIMAEARDEYGDDVDHTDVTLLAAKRHGVKWD